MHCEIVKSRGKDLESAEDVLKVMLSMTEQRHLTTSGNIVKAVNWFRKGQGRPEVSERTIRKRISFLASVQVIEKKNIEFEKLLDPHDDEIREKNALRSVYGIAFDKVRSNIIDLDLSDYQSSISKLPSNVRQELISEKRRQLLEINNVRLVEDFLLLKYINYKNADSRNPDVVTLRSYWNKKSLKEAMDYLRRLK